MRAAIYARVSTKDKGQDTENQLVQLREYARRQQWEITCEYIDHESGKTGDRDAFWQLFDGGVEVRVRRCAGLGARPLHPRGRV